MNDRSNDYVFLSYSHKDHIDALLAQFGEHGYNIVYDDALISAAKNAGASSFS